MGTDVSDSDEVRISVTRLWLRSFWRHFTEVISSAFYPEYLPLISRSDVYYLRSLMYQSVDPVHRAVRCDSFVCRVILYEVNSTKIIQGVINHNSLLKSLATCVNFWTVAISVATIQINLSFRSWNIFLVKITWEYFYEKLIRKYCY